MAFGALVGAALAADRWAQGPAFAMVGAAAAADRPETLLASLDTTSSLTPVDAGTAAVRPGAATNPFLDRALTARPAVVRARSTQELDHMLQTRGVDVTAVRDQDRAVPQVILASFPADLPDVDNARDRKRLFLNAMLPIVLSVNAEISQERGRLLRLRAKADLGQVLSRAEIRWLAEISDKYEVDNMDLDDLLIRVDVVPPSMALAQAAVESGWGTSRLSMTVNALFGQITSARDGVPARSGKYRYATFDGLIDSVRSYARNLNTHPAYRDFRAQRHDKRRHSKPLDGYALMAGLTEYSEKGNAYIRYVRSVIRTNALTELDDARLGRHGRDAVAAL